MWGDKYIDIHSIMCHVELVAICEVLRNDNNYCYMPVTTLPLMPGDG